jgi:hypothetical protein
MIAYEKVEVCHPIVPMLSSSGELRSADPCAGPIRHPGTDISNAAAGLYKIPQGNLKF